MKSKLKKRVSIIIILISLGILFALTPIINNTLNFNVGNSGRSSESSDEINFYNKNLKPSKISGPIIIDDTNPSHNWSVAKGTGICTGNGTFSDPYVIEDLVIDGGGSESCIYIQYSDIYFRIENCTLYNSGGDHTAGILLNNTDNGFLIDNNCSLNLYGIFLKYSGNNTISGNIANNNSIGIGLSFGDYNIISGNTANSNTFIGISLSKINDNTISGNTANDNHRGITLFNCDGNIISGNTANDNTYDGIILSDNGDDNTISGNTANDNHRGITITYRNNTLSGNVMNGCGLEILGLFEELNSHDIDATNLVNGKSLYYYTNEINLAPSNFTNAGQVILVNCTDSLISNLNTSNCYKGISLHYCNNNTVSGNTANNNDRGIYLGSSNNNTVSRNTANNNDRGIYIHNSDYNTITGNTAKLGGVGITLHNSNYNIVSGNTLLGNYECIVEDNCEGNIFENNDCGESNGIPFELIILISVISGGAAIGVATLLLIRRKRKRIE